MTKTYFERLTEDRRLALLQMLAETPGFEASAQVLARSLTTRTAAASGDQVATDLAWLAEQGLVTVDHVVGISMARITPRGMDAASGLANVPGVARPGP